MKKGNDKSRQPPLIAFFWPILWIALLLLLIIHACHMDYTWKKFAIRPEFMYIENTSNSYLKIASQYLFLGHSGKDSPRISWFSSMASKSKKVALPTRVIPSFFIWCKQQNLRYILMFVYNFSIFKWRFSLFELSRPNNADEKQLKWNTHGVIELPIS